MRAPDAISRITAANKMNGWSTQSAPTIRSFTQCLLTSGRNRELWILSNGALQIWPPFSAFCKTAKLLVLSAFENAILSTQSAPTILSFTQSRLWHLPSLMCENCEHSSTQMEHSRTGNISNLCAKNVNLSNYVVVILIVNFGNYVVVILMENCES